MAGVIERGASYAKGGEVTKTEKATVHKGEFIVPKGKKKKSDCSCKSSGMKR